MTHDHVAEVCAEIDQANEGLGRALVEARAEIKQLQAEVENLALRCESFRKRWHEVVSKRLADRVRVQPLIDAVRVWNAVERDVAAESLDQHERDLIAAVEAFNKSASVGAPGAQEVEVAECGCPITRKQADITTHTRECSTAQQVARFTVDDEYGVDADEDGQCPFPNGDATSCLGCGQPWPCRADLIEELERQRDDIERAREVMGSDAYRLATGETCVPGQTASCGDFHNGGHCVRPRIDGVSDEKRADVKVELFRAGIVPQADPGFCTQCGAHLAGEHFDSCPVADPAITRPRGGGEGRPEPTDWLVWSNRHNNWWRAWGCGYTLGLREAGRYSHEAALAICERTAWESGVPSEVMIPAPDASIIAAWGQLQDTIPDQIEAAIQAAIAKRNGAS